MNPIRSKIKIIIVDDHVLFRNGLVLLLNSNVDFEVIAEASNGKEFLEILKEMTPDIVLMDISMPEMDGVKATELAIEKNPELKIITLSMFGDEEYYYKMMDAGACAFLLKESDIDEVYSAIYNVMDGNSFFSKELLQNLISNFKDEDSVHDLVKELSEREIEITVLVCDGLSNQEIAEKLFLSKRTVEKHRANILTKLNLKNTASLVMFAIKNKLVNL